MAFLFYTEIMSHQAKQFPPIQSISKSLAKSHSLYSHLARIPSPYFGTLQQTSQISLQQQQQHSLFSQASWGRLEMKPERNKFKVQAILREVAKKHQMNIKKMFERWQG